MVRKEKISVTLDPTLLGDLDECVGEEYDTRSEAVRDLLSGALHADGDESRNEYEERLDEVERENDRLRREKRLILEQREEHADLVAYVEDERELQRRRDERERRKETANVLTRAKWWLTGMPENGTHQASSDSE